MSKIKNNNFIYCNDIEMSYYNRKRFKFIKKEIE